MADIHEITALELRGALRRGELSARETAAHFLDRINQHNPGLGAFVSVTADAALTSAAAADAHHAAGGQLAALHGMPVAYKDVADVAGSVTTHGSAALDHRAAVDDGPLVAMLRRQGVISLGKTQVPEFGLTSYSENRVAPPARNPFDRKLSPGGSSGGSAAAVAARLVPFAPASDGGGSIRIPAAATGLVGLKTNRGRVPSGSGQSDVGGLVVAGPLAHTAVDAAMLLDAMVSEANHRSLSAVPVSAAGPGPRAAAGHPPSSFLEAAQRAEGRFRIGISTTSPFEGHFPIELSAETMDAFDAGIGRLGALGHDLVQADIRYDPRYADAFTTVWTSGVAAAPLAPEREAELMPLTRTYRRRARLRSGVELSDAVSVLRAFEADSISQYADYDMVLTPALATTPRPIGWYTEDPDEDYRRQCQYCPFSSMVNVIGLPAITAPTLTTSGGLPMGIQLIGRPSGEASLLAVVAQLMQ